MCSILAVENIRTMEAVFDLVVDGEAALVGHRVGSDPARHRPCDPRHDGACRASRRRSASPTSPASPTRRVEVWLPHRSVVELRAVRVNDGASVSAPPSRRRWVHYGSSISHCLEVDHPTDAWPAITARRADVDLVNLGVAGQCHARSARRRARSATSTSTSISVKAGINIVEASTMKERVFVPALHGFLDTVRDGHPDVPIVVAHADHLAAVRGRRERRAISRCAASARSCRRSSRHGSPRATRSCTWSTGSRCSAPTTSADLPDGLHPNARGLPTDRRALPRSRVRRRRTVRGDLSPDGPSPLARARAVRVDRAADGVHRHRDQHRVPEHRRVVLDPAHDARVGHHRLLDRAGVVAPGERAPRGPRRAEAELRPRALGVRRDVGAVRARADG